MITGTDQWNRPRDQTIIFTKNVKYFSNTDFSQVFSCGFQFSAQLCRLLPARLCRLFERQRVLRTGRKNFQSSIFNLQFIKVPSTLCSDASFASFQRLLLYSAGHQHASFKASARLVQGIPTNGSRYSRHPSPTEPRRHVARCSVAVHNEAVFYPYLYLYLYIYKYIYKYKVSFIHLALLDKQLQHCNAARNCATDARGTGKAKGI